jgi:alpha-galactosidase/6-phospho-beta-glucosidase family protein
MKVIGGRYAVSKKIKLAFVGGGSYHWAPRIIKDILLKRDLEEIQFYLLDKNLGSANKIKVLCEKMNSDLKTGHTFVATDNEEDAFQGCDFVIICISTGGLEAMRHDIAIPEKYGIYATVGDTVGPGGWSRNLRNIPVFNGLARKIEKLSNQAVVMNYTNPMACLTKAFYAQSNLRAVGLCHGLFENYYALQAIFGLESERQLDIRFGGVNHFFWMLDMKVNGQDGYAWLRNKLGTDKRFVDLMNELPEDEAGFKSNKFLASELFETFGYLPYVGDRHTCEFLPHIITGSEKRLGKYQIKRTTIEEREAILANRIKEIDQMISGEQAIDYTKSRETAADILEAVALGKEFIDIINVPNTGQIPSLPLGGIVESLGVINSLGFTPISVGPLPEPINRLVLPHFENSEIIYQAATEGDFELALQALYNDPTCSHLDYKEIRAMAIELIAANQEYLPQFKHAVEYFL